jgi:PKD repeat protein
VFAASGDRGAQDCYHGNPADALYASVEDPSSQPFVTGVGGTRVNALGPPPSESVWNNGPGSAGGGGLSAYWSMPSYQSGAPSSLNVINADSSGAPCGAPTGTYCREVPDISADADPNTGYAIYHGGWATVGGTSASTPTWAALAALINASSACSGQMIGFANPVLYRVAATSYGAAFNDVTIGNNDANGTLGGLFPAGPAYDMASGLGTPIGSNLATAACTRPTARFRITNTSHPGTGQPVQFDGSTSSEAGGSIAGYSWNFGDGGTATGPKPMHTYRTKGTYKVTLVVTDRAGQTGPTSASLFVGKGGKITKVKVRGQMITVRVNGPGKLKIGSHRFNIKKSKGKKVSVFIRRKGSRSSVKVKINFTPKYGNLQTRKVKVKF